MARKQHVHVRFAELSTRERHGYRRLYYNYGIFTFSRGLQPHGHAIVC
jgi:hypothetical protein